MTSTKSKPARIITMPPASAPVLKWAWRDSWYSGGESIYALLAKFSALNQITEREFFERFIQESFSRRNGKRSHQLTHSKVDLRYAEHIKIPALSRAMKLNAEQIRKGFVAEQFPQVILLASSNLIWCPQCAERGFHSASFQLNFFRVCPLHHQELRRTCSKCHQSLPYALHPSLDDNFFICSNCGKDHAPRLREPPKKLLLQADMASKMEDHVELIRLLVDLPTMVNAQKSEMGAPFLPIIISKADSSRRCREFHQFVTDVLASVAVRRGLTQGSLAYVEPSAVYSERYLRLPTIIRTSRLDRSSADMLREASVIYRAMRRWIVRHVVCGHRSCISSAQKHLWWDLEGEKTAAFCPVALAFLRWRMQWEGGRVPARLDQSRVGRDPLGLVSWIAADAPIPSSMWTRDLEKWITNHLVGIACFDSFIGWLSLSKTTEQSGRLCWQQRDYQRFTFRHWACSGRGTEDEPALFYVESSQQIEHFCWATSSSRKHRKAHLLALKSIQR